jgi:hypothetical protein
VNPANDTARCNALVLGPYRDVMTTRITVPQGTIDSGTTVVPAAWVRNSGGLDVVFAVRMGIGTVYADTQTVTLAGWDSVEVLFEPWDANAVGRLIVRCSTMLEHDSFPSNNRVGLLFEVIPPGGIAASDTLPSVYLVGDWCPNPARSGARLRYELPHAVSVRAAVYSANGRLVRTVADGVQSAGYHNLAWDGCDDFGRRCVPGVYFCCVRVGPMEKTTKLTLLR